MTDMASKRIIGPRVAAQSAFPAARLKRFRL
jgi:hypothetical protein